MPLSKFDFLYPIALALSFPYICKLALPLINCHVAVADGINRSVYGSLHIKSFNRSGSSPCTCNGHNIVSCLEAALDHASGSFSAAPLTGTTIGESDSSPVSALVVLFARQKIYNSVRIHKFDEFFSKIDNFCICRNPHLFCKGIHRLAFISAPLGEHPLRPTHSQPEWCSPFLQLPSFHSA